MFLVENERVAASLVALLRVCDETEEFLGSAASDDGRVELGATEVTKMAVLYTRLRRARREGVAALNSLRQAQLAFEGTV